MASPKWGILDTVELAYLLQYGGDRLLLIDSRSFLEYNTCNISSAVNVCCSKLVKRRLQQDKVTVKELLNQACEFQLDESYDIVVYDQCTENPEALTQDYFLIVLLDKLAKAFKKVRMLKGGFLEFQATHPSLCENKSADYTAPLTSMSQPCMPVSNIGPTKILPYLYLGSQNDALSLDTIQKNGINYVLNVSLTCPKPGFIQEGHFLRIPVNDNYSAKLHPHFNQAFQFLDKVREANGCVLVHCLAGISRSPTLAIAYIMNQLSISSDEAYRYVKDKRPNISPNFNFLGQLLEYEKQLKNEQGGAEECNTPNATPTPTAMLDRPQWLMPMPSSPALTKPKFQFNFFNNVSSQNAQSPTTALAKLNFNQAGTPDTPTPEKTFTITSFPTTSLDKLNFTPCLANEDLHRPKTSGTKRPHSIELTEGLEDRSQLGPTSSTKRPLSTGDADIQSDNNANMCNVSSGAKISTGTKRPLCFGTTLDSFKPSEEKSMEISKKCDNKMGGGSENTVTLRSHETRAKRPLVRPNSIAFSTLPNFDLSSDSSSSPDCKSTSNEKGNKSIGSSAYKRMFMAECNKYVTSAVQTYSKNVALENALGRARSFENCRKSRSLDDILSSPEDDDKQMNCDCVGSASKKSRFKSAMVSDVFSQNVGLEQVQCRCRGTSDPHQSSSSISSSGSHNSLHGSLEIIQVS